MVLFRNYYRCEACLTTWDDVWPHTCDDKCPRCNTATSPYRSDDEPGDVKDRKTILAIRDLNDAFRTTFTGGRVMRSSGVAALPDAMQERVFDAIKTHNGFTPDDDPSGERNVAIVEVDGAYFVFEIQYRNIDERFDTDDPSDPKVTKRVGTIMLESEYVLR